MNAPAATNEPRTLEYVRPWLYPKQVAALFAPVRYSIIEASTKSGKTVGCIVWLFEQAAINGKPGRNYWWVAPTLPVAKIAYRRMKRAIPRHLYKANDTETTITLINGAVLWFKGADRPDLLYGEDVHAAVIDEATRCKPEAFEAVRSTLTATKGPVRIIGNVRGRGNWAYRLARKAEGGAKNMAYFKLTALDAISAGIFDHDELEDAKGVISEDTFRELYFAEAADDGSNPFSMSAIAACAVPLGEWEERAAKLTPLAFGWDYARAEDWTVGVGIDQGYEVCRFHRWQRVPWHITKADCKKYTGETPAWGDSTGVGDSVVEDIQRLGSPLIGYHFSQKSKQVLMERLAGAIQAKTVRYPDGPIRAELDSFGYEYTAHGVRYSAPEGMHDDCVYALALAVYGRDHFGAIHEPVKPDIKDDDTHPGTDYGTGERKDKLRRGFSYLEHGDSLSRHVPDGRLEEISL